LDYRGEIMQVNPSRIAEDIQAQPKSLACVLEQQRGSGLSPLLRAAALLRKANRVLITGIGASMFASIALENFLCSRGIDAIVIEAAEMLHYRHSAYRDAVVVMVSRSGESIEITKLLLALKGRLPIIGVLNEPASALCRQADVSLYVGSLSDETVAIQTYTGTLLTLRLLGSAVVNELDGALAETEAILPVFSHFVSNCFADLQKWNSFLEADTIVHLLARGPSCASAMEGSLLFNEIAKAPAVGMPAASFRHGPVELVDPSFRGLIFAPSGRTRELNLALAQDLTRFGGRIRVIGPSQPDVHGLEWLPTPTVVEMSAPLFEIIPVQIAALRLAQLRGIPVGSFRYAPQVARDEAVFHSG
jgi:glucosamine--fructose-6-phosphate aminotransferase (isomerizing)